MIVAAARKGDTRTPAWVRYARLWANCAVNQVAARRVREASRRSLAWPRAVMPHCNGNRRQPRFDRLSLSSSSCPELDDGTIQVRHAGKVLPVAQFGREDLNITQGAVVASKLLGGVLEQIKDKQAKKDSDKFGKLRTQREKRLFLQRAKAVA
jgi:hypothetical protein